MRTNRNTDRSSIPGQQRPASRDASNNAPKAAESTSDCRALIPLSPARATAHTQNVEPRPASFLAHLIATKQGMPQTRERRRIEPELAVATYAAAARVPAQFAHALSQAA